MRRGSTIKKKMSVWHCLERLAAERNPRLIALIEIKDAQQPLKLRTALQALAAGKASKAQIANAKRLLAQP